MADALASREELVRQADRHQRQGRNDLAIGIYERLAGQTPTDWNVVKQLADLCERAGQREAAAARFLQLADHYFEEGFHPRASALYRKVLKLDPNSERALCQLAEIALEQKLKVDARQALTQVLTLRRRRGDTAGAEAIAARLAEVEGIPAVPAGAVAGAEDEPPAPPSGIDDAPAAQAASGEATPPPAHEPPAETVPLPQAQPEPVAVDPTDARSTGHDAGSVPDAPSSAVSVPPDAAAPSPPPPASSPASTPATQSLAARLRALADDAVMRGDLAAARRAWTAVLHVEPGDRDVRLRLLAAAVAEQDVAAAVTLVEGLDGDVAETLAWRFRVARLAGRGDDAPLVTSSLNGGDAALALAVRARLQASDPEAADAWTVLAVHALSAHADPAVLAAFANELRASVSGPPTADREPLAAAREPRTVDGEPQTPDRTPLAACSEALTADREPLGAFGEPQADDGDPLASEGLADSAVDDVALAVDAGAAGSGAVSEAVGESPSPGVVSLPPEGGTFPWTDAEADTAAGISALDAAFAEEAERLVTEATSEAAGPADDSGTAAGSLDAWLLGATTPDTPREAVPSEPEPAASPVGFDWSALLGRDVTLEQNSVPVPVADAAPAGDVAGLPDVPLSVEEGSAVTAADPVQPPEPERAVEAPPEALPQADPTPDVEMRDDLVPPAVMATDDAPPPVPAPEAAAPPAEAPGLDATVEPEPARADAHEWLAAPDDVSGPDVTASAEAAGTGERPAQDGAAPASAPASVPPPVTVPDEVDLTDLLDELVPAMPAAPPAPPPAQTQAELDVAASPVVNDGESERTQAMQQVAAGRVFAAAGLVAEAARAFERASKDVRTRFEAAAALAELHRSRGQLAEAVRWYEMAAEAPAPDATARRPVLYDLAETLETVGAADRALAVLLDLLSEVEDYRDARARADRLLRVDAGG